MATRSGRRRRPTARRAGQAEGLLWKVCLACDTLALCRREPIPYLGGRFWVCPSCWADGRVSPNTIRLAGPASA